MSNKPIIALSVVLCFLLVALSLPCIAQGNPENPCNKPTTLLVHEYIDAVDGARARCVPYPIGTGTVPYIRWNKAGIVGWSFWSTASGFNLVSDTAAIAASSDPLTSMNSMIASRATTPMHDPSLTPVWCPFADEMFATVPPRVYKWAVAKNGTYQTRPSYALSGSTIGATVGRATVGAKCDCSKPAVCTKV
jgi:hypothetical protein